MINTFTSLVRSIGLILLLTLTMASAHADTFDLTTFAPPAGSRTEVAQNLTFIESTPTTFVIYGIFKGVPGSGDPAQDFQTEWHDLVLPNHRVTGELKTETVDWPGGWKMTMGAAKAWTEAQRNFVDLMSVFTGYGMKVTVLVTYNDDMYRPKIDKFLASLRLQAPTVSSTQPVAPPPSADTQTGAHPSSLTSHEWYRSIASTWNGDGYVRYRYRFQPNGRYSFIKEWWSQYHYQDYWFIEETGRYTVTGNTLRIQPEKASKILRDKADKMKGGPEAVALETATYRFTFKDLYKPTLILTPTSGKTTERDGKMFSRAGDGQSYYYEPPSPCEQRPLPAECKS
ncbi:MAG: hypothetical protein GC149_15090 [Gammaproteobacteria bacterium]|nr:hypothetical protein [Gammaproteobacteria bacterium]